MSNEQPPIVAMEPVSMPIVADVADVNANGKRIRDEPDKENSTPEPLDKKIRLFKSREEREREVEEKRLKKLEEQARRDAEREEKKRLKEAEKAEKEQLRRLKEQQKEEERRVKEEQKEQERRAKEEQKEQERRIKEKQKEEELRIKEEQKEKKVQEKLEREAQKAELQERKREEKRAKDEEKRAKEEEENKKKLVESRQKSLMSKFFSVKPKPKSPVKAKPDTETSDFHSYFLPFHIKANVEIVPRNAFVSAPPEQGDALEFLKNHKVERGFSPPKSTLEIVDLMNKQSNVSDTAVLDMLMALPRKHIQFSDDVRPPYVGTFSKPRCTFACTPCERACPTINYDYDSELEWVQEDDGDGEDLDGDDDSESEEDDDEGMDKFVDPNDDTARRRIIGPLTPITKWNDGSDPILFGGLEMEFLINSGPIDPFFDYWQDKKTPGADAKVETPLADKLVPRESMKEFLTRIQGSDMNQTFLIETLKKEFPQLSKDVIKNTIKSSAQRVGDKKTDKRWKINEPLRLEYQIGQAV